MVGGEEMSTEFGKYFVSLGDEERFYDLVCYGIPQITAEFRKYDLSVVNHEFRNDCYSGENLPTAVGGGSVSLLIGIQNVKLEPVLKFR